MHPNPSSAFLLCAAVHLSRVFAVDFSMMSVSGTRAGSGNPVYTRCTNVASGTCCFALTPYDMAAFDHLPENAVATYWSWTESPNLPADNHAKCDQKLLKCDASYPFSWYAAPIPHSPTATRLIITGGRWRAWSREDGGIMTGIMSDITSMCKNLFTRSNSVASRINQRASNAAGNEPSDWVYPDVIIYNKTEYTDNRRNDKVYKDSMGNVFDLKLLDA